MGTPRASATETAFAGEIELTFPFREELVDDLKAEIPARHRSWDPDDKVWRVRGPFARTAVDLLLDHFPGATVPVAYRRPTVRIRNTAAVPPVPEAPPPTDVAGAESSAVMVAVQCPNCRKRHDVSVYAIAESSFAVAKREATPPEMIAVCPECNTLEVVSFHPALPLVAAS